MHIVRRSLPTRSRLLIAVALLLISLVPTSVGVAQSDGGRLAADTNGAICANCCVSECYTGTWMVSWMKCLPGGDGSCMSCDTTCGPYFPKPGPIYVPQ